MGFKIHGVSFPWDLGLEGMGWMGWDGMDELG